MAQEAYLDSKGGDFLQSSSSSTCTKEGGYASPLDFPFSNVKMAQLNANLASGDVDSTLLDKFTDPVSGISINSLVADANLIYSTEAFLQRSGNDGMKYLNLPSSPKSLLSGNLRNSTMDVSWATQQNSVADQNSQLRRKIPKLGSPAPLTESKLQNHPFSLPTGMKQDSNSLIPMLKKPRIGANANIPQEQNAQQLLLRQDIKQLPDHHPQLRALLQHHRQQILDSLPQFCGAQAQQSEQQFRHHLQQRVTCPISSGDDGMCSQRIQFLYNLKNQPQDNSMDFWRKIVSDFYAPCAKERWCLSSYKHIGRQALGILSLGAVGEWCCDLCGSGAGKGFGKWITAIIVV